MSIWETECRDSGLRLLITLWFPNTRRQATFPASGTLIFAGSQTDVAINLEGHLAVVLGSLDHHEESSWINPECKGREARGSMCRRWKRPGPGRGQIRPQIFWFILCAGLAVWEHGGLFSQAVAGRVTVSVYLCLSFSFFIEVTPISTPGEFL